MYDVYADAGSAGTRFYNYRKMESQFIQRAVFVLAEQMCTGWCWNALCLLPQGQIPQGYRGIWCLGGPGWLLAPGRVARSAGPAAPWLAELPRVEALRRLYQAARRALAAPLSGLSALAFCRSLGQEAGLSPAGCLAGLLVLRDMDLVSWQARPGQSPLFQRITLLRGWEVDDGETAPTAL